jgi:hypothetical protein
MLTSCFSKLKMIAAPLEPVAISRGIPRYYKGRRCLDLAPTREMLELPLPELVKQFRKTLTKLDPAKTAAELGDNAVLLCWERPGVKCHRRIVADWFLDKIGLVVPEHGLGEVARFSELPEAK